MILTDTIQHSCHHFWHRIRISNNNIPTRLPSTTYLP